MRGGARQGAGRKALQEGTTRIHMTIRVSAETAERLKQLKEESGKSIGQVIDDLAK